MFPFPIINFLTKKQTMETNNKQTRRTPEEIIAEKMAEIARLQAKQVLSNAKDNALLDPITNLITSGRESYTKAAHHFSGGAQSFEKRLHAYDLKKAEVTAEMNLQAAMREFYRSQKDYFSDLLVEASEMIINGVSDEDITLFIEEKTLDFNENNSATFEVLEEIRDDARDDRIEFTQTRVIKNN
jgi:hypothetical protein